MMKKVKDFNEMGDRELLNELANRIVRYEKKISKYIWYLRVQLSKAGVDYEELKGYEKALIGMDEEHCKVREMLRFVKNDPNFMWE